MNIAGFLDISENLTVNGATTLLGNVVLNNNMDVSGNAVVHGRMDLSGDFVTDGSMNIAGFLDISENLTVNGATTLLGNVVLNNNMDISGNAVIHGRMDLSGAMTIGSGNNESTTIDDVGKITANKISLEGNSVELNISDAIILNTEGGVGVVDLSGGKIINIGNLYTDDGNTDYNVAQSTDTSDPITWSDISAVVVGGFNNPINPVYDVRFNNITSKGKTSSDIISNNYDDVGLYLILTGSQLTISGEHIPGRIISNKDITIFNNNTYLFDNVDVSLNIAGQSVVNNATEFTQIGVYDYSGTSTDGNNTSYAGGKITVVESYIQMESGLEISGNMVIIGDISANDASFNSVAVENFNGYNLQLLQNQILDISASTRVPTSQLVISGGAISDPNSVFSYTIPSGADTIIYEYRFAFSYGAYTPRIYILVNSNSTNYDEHRLATSDNSMNDMMYTVKCVIKVSDLTDNELTITTHFDNMVTGTYKVHTMSNIQQFSGSGGIINPTLIVTTMGSKYGFA